MNGFQIRSGKQPFRLTTALSTEDVYRLLTIFIASQPIAALDSNNPNRHPNRQINEWAILGAQREVPKFLLRLAATIRTKDDDGSWLSRPNAIVGKLTNDLDQPSVKIDLSLREACNNILHGKRVHLDVNKHETTGAEYVNPIV